ncbi:MAG: helix-turn-helix domain-containing protein [Luteolibacter sp.]
METIVDVISKRYKSGPTSIRKALDIIDILLVEPATMASICRSTGICAPTAHRLVLALESRGYVHRTSTGCRLGPRLLLMGSRVAAQIDLLALARPFLTDLSTKTGFCACAGRREGDLVRHIGRSPGQHRLQVTTMVGAIFPLRSTAIGSALLLDAPDEDSEPEGKVPHEDVIEQVIGGQKSLIQVEAISGITTIACPVRDATGRIVLALGLEGATYHAPQVRWPGLAAALLEAACRMEVAIGRDGTARR